MEEGSHLADQESRRTITLTYGEKEILCKLHQKGKESPKESQIQSAWIHVAETVVI